MGETAKNWLDVLAESIIKSRWRYYIFLTLVLILILTWFLVSFVWSISDTQYRYTNPPIEIPNTTQKLRVDYPLFLRYGGPPAELRLTRWTTDTLGTLSKPLTASLSFPPHIVLVNGDSPFIDSSVVFSSTTAQTQTTRLYLLNGQIETVFNGEHFLSGTTLQTVTIMAGYSPPKPLLIKVEQPSWRPILRGFINPVGTQSPLLTYLLPALLALFSLLIATRFNQRKELLHSFRQALTEGNVDSALNHVENLKEVSSRNEFKTAELLLEIAQGRGNLSRILNSKWTDEARGAVLAGIQALLPETKEKWIAVLDREIDKGKQQDWWTEARTKLEGENRSRENWRLKPVYNFTRASALENLAMAERFRHDNHIYDPFANLYAESDVGFLFSKDIDGFWREHPQLSQIYSEQTPCVCFGASGSGKTAIAQHLVYRDWEREDTLALYRVNLLPPQLERAIAETMLDFLCARPFVWWQAGQIGRRILAKFFCRTLGDEMVSAKVEERLRQLPRHDYREFEAATEKQKDIWRDEDEAALKAVQSTIIAQSLTQGGASARLKDDDWLRVARLAMQVLGVQQMVVAVDSNELSFIKPVLTCMEQWGKYGLIFKLFVPNSLFPELRPHLKRVHFQLDWSPKSLEDMANWRFLRASSGEVNSLNDLFKNDCKDELKHLFSLFNTPHDLITFWQTLIKIHTIHNSDSLTFRLKDLQQILKGVS